MADLVGRIENAIISNPQLVRDIGDYFIDINANPIDELGNFLDGTEKARSTLLSSVAVAVVGAAIEQSGLRERLQQGTINLYNNTRARITHGADSLRQRWNDRRNRPVQARADEMVGGKNKKSKRRSKKSKRRRRKYKTHRRSR